MRKFELKIEEQDIREVANAFVSYQYAMYGLSNVPEDILKEITLKATKITSTKFRELK